MQELLYSGQQDYWSAAGNDTNYIAGPPVGCGENLYTQQLGAYNAAITGGGRKSRRRRNRKGVSLKKKRHRLKRTRTRSLKSHR